VGISSLCPRLGAFPSPHIGDFFFKIHPLEISSTISNKRFTLKGKLVGLQLALELD
jgi:hypothetical protein